MSTFVHFHTLRERVRSHPTTPVFKLPKHGRWIDVSYTQFQADIERTARYWLNKLALPPRSVVGIWLRGFTYSDVVTIFAVSRAGYIPQMFGFELPNTRIVYELLTTYAGKAIIHDPAKSPLLAAPQLPCYVAVDYTAISDAEVNALQMPLVPLPVVGDEDWAFIYHTSGSVSGMPKVVPKTNKWLSIIEHKSPEAFCIGDYEGQDVYLWTESFSHSMEICLLQLILHRAGCLVQPTRIDFSSAELAAMIRIAGVNRVIQFTNVLRVHLEDARKEASEGGENLGLLGLLKNVRQVTYAGMPLATELEDWAVEQGIPMTNNFGCTECGQLLTSTPGNRALKMLPTIAYKFVPVPASVSASVSLPSIPSLPNPTAETPPSPTASALSASISSASSLSASNSSGPESSPEAEADNGTSATATYKTLLELWILPTSPDLPIPALRTADGGWRSGDLFEEVGEGRYMFRGRDDDWIKSLWSERLDTKSIEDNIYTTCADIVANCVVVGNGRPFPALFVEPRVPASNKEAEEALKKEIVKRTEAFHSMRYLHERIQDTRMIKVVPPKTLPRTAAKGNIRRRAVEQDYEAELEAMYASVPVEEVFASVLEVKEATSGSQLQRPVVEVAAAA